jgi:hypothetical protein
MLIISLGTVSCFDTTEMFFSQGFVCLSLCVPFKLHLKSPALVVASYTVLHYESWSESSKTQRWTSCQVVGRSQVKGKWSAIACAYFSMSASGLWALPRFS